MTPHYAMLIWWSPDDECFVGIVSELAGCMADGETPVACAAALQKSAEGWIEVARKLGREIPPPRPPPINIARARAIRDEYLKAIAHLT